MRLKAFLLLTFFSIFINPFTSFSQEEAAVGIDQKINNFFKPIADFISGIVFYDISISGHSVPIVLIILLGGATFFTLYFRFPNIRLLELLLEL